MYISAQLQPVPTQIQVKEGKKEKDLLRKKRPPDEPEKNNEKQKVDDRFFCTFIVFKAAAEVG
jgi:hypothetical protein